VRLQCFLSQLMMTQYADHARPPVTVVCIVGRGVVGLDPSSVLYNEAQISIPVVSGQGKALLRRAATAE
jgi:hypothetical protein